jgi:hypothetical protein
MSQDLYYCTTKTKTSHYVNLKYEDDPFPRIAIKYLVLKDTCTQSSSSFSERWLILDNSTDQEALATDYLVVQRVATDKASAEKINRIFWQNISYSQQFTMSVYYCMN